MYTPVPIHSNGIKVVPDSTGSRTMHIMVSSVKGIPVKRECLIDTMSDMSYQHSIKGKESQKLTNFMQTAIPFIIGICSNEYGTNNLNIDEFIIYEDPGVNSITAYFIIHNDVYGIFQVGTHAKVQFVKSLSDYLA